MPRNRIRQLREEEGLTQLQLAARFRVVESTISRWESGRVTIPDQTKADLAQFFGCSVPYLLGFGDEGDRS